jgi:hypothetical protein
MTETTETKTRRDAVSPMAPPVRTKPARFVRLALAEALTGYTVSAMETKIARGVWLEDFEYVRAPDNAILIDMEGYELWATGHRRAA